LFLASLKMISNKFKIFLIALFVSLPIFWGVNVSESKLENFFFSQLYIETPGILTAQLISQSELPKPQESFYIAAKSAFSLKINHGETWDILYQKNIKEKLPIASLTKLMTVLVVLKNYDLSLPIKISKAAVEQEEDLGQLKTGETLTAKDLLYIMLIESSNDAAYALADAIGEKNFVDVMNWEAESLGLKNTHFANPNGLDDPQNYSSAQDLAILTRNLLEKPLLWQILGTLQYDLYLPDGTLHHQLKNTNELLRESASWRTKMIGGKTGWSPEAQGCLVSVLKDDKGEYSINVILGAEDRFAEMKKLIQITAENN
jgi:D-alanyl-D-alanine carboxypeptidase (penicillin-binding protein 5/6)